MREFFYSTVLVWFLTLSISASAEGVAAGDAVLNQDYAPLEKNPPVYPHVSQFNGIEGYCIVEYTVTTTGAVQDAFPEECQPIGLFEGISVEAALSFRYQPRVIDGVAVDVPGVKNKFVYDLRGPGKRMDFTNEPVRWSFIQENDTRRINQRIEKQDWKKLKKYALSRKGPNYRMLYFAGFAEIMMGNKDAGYEYIEQFVFHEKEGLPFEFVTFNALKLLITHYYQTQQYEALIALDKHADVWWFRLLEEETTNQMALMIADAYTRVGDNDASVKRLSEIVDRARTETAKEDRFVAIARRALGQ
jgi:hypothetical protein